MTIEARIRADIEGRIRSGEWGPGTRVPTEHELVAAYGCARATVNKALSRLAHEGLIERRRRIGSVVARQRVRSAVMGVPDVATMVAARGEAYRWELCERSIGRAPAALAGSSGHRWLKLAGMHHAGGRAFGWELRWLDLDSVAGAEAVDFEQEAPGSWLMDHIAWTDARHRISAVAASAPIAERLDIAPGAPCLQIEHWAWRAGAPVTAARQTFPGDRYDLVEEFTPRG